MLATAEHDSRRVVQRTLGAAALVVLVPVAAWGANVRFLPALELRAYHDGNVNNVGPITEAMAGRATVELGLNVESPTTVWELLYAPYHDEYPDQEDLSFTGHVLRSNLNKRFSAQSSLHFNVDAARLRTQEFSAIRPDEGTSLLPRTTTDRGFVGLGGRVGVSQRGGMLWDLEAAEMRYADDPTLPLNNHRTSAAQLGWQYLSPGGMTTGLVASARAIDYEVLPIAYVATAHATVGRQLGPTGRMELWGGASRLDQDDEQVVEPTYDVSFEWRPRPLTVLSLGTNRAISPGSGRAGATLDDGVYFGWRRLPAQQRGFLLTVLAGYTRRDDVLTFPEVPPEAVNYLEISETVSWVLDRHFRIGVFHRYHDQDDRTGSELDSNFHTFGVLFRVEAAGVPRPPFTATPAGRALEQRYMATDRARTDSPKSTNDDQEPS